MCRYAFHHYRTHFACFDCRIGLKSFESKGCPRCGKAMAKMGHDFKAPPHYNLKGWEAARLLIQHGIDYNSCGCQGPGYRPTTPQEARHWIRAHHESRLFARSKGAELLARLPKIKVKVRSS